MGEYRPQSRGHTGRETPQKVRRKPEGAEEPGAGRPDEQRLCGISGGGIRGRAADVCAVSETEGRDYHTDQRDRSLESALNELKADNDALYNTVTASVDLEQIRKEAMDRLGMDYPNEDQIYQFDTSGNSYVRQYKDVPDE